MYNITLPICMDYEWCPSQYRGECRLYNSGQNAAQRTAVANAFMNQCAVNGYTGALYANKSTLENYFDGEVSILIVDKNFRGQKIGEKLLLEVFKMAKKDNMKNLQILTDESCNYHFYEKCGCKKIYETIIEDIEYGKLEKNTDEKAFIYEKIL